MNCNKHVQHVGSLFAALIIVLAMLPISSARAVTVQAESTEVSGIISTNTTWTAANSPYIVTGSVLVNAGVTLTIEPGVVVKFNSAMGLQVDGQLIARGTENEPIVFTSNQPSPTSGDWVNILFTDSSIDATYDEDSNYLSGSIMQYCTVEYGGRGGASGINIMSSSPSIDHSVVRNNSYRGISVEEGAPRIYNNTIEANSSSAIHAHSESVYSPPTVTIRGNTISGNLASGIVIIGISAVIEDNTITNNSGIDGGGIHIYTLSKVTIRGNSITRNSASNRGGGIFNNQYYAQVIIVANTITGNLANNEGGGIWTAYIYEGRTTISYNELSSNIVGSITGGGIEVTGGQPTISYNNIQDNSPYDLRNRLSWTSPSVDATCNWWGTTNETAIQAHIYDWHDDAGLGIINYIPYLTGPVVPASFDLVLKAGWNLVSLPLDPGVTDPDIILQDVGWYSIYAWDAIEKKYVKPGAEGMVVGKGYWVMVLNNVTQSITGLPVTGFAFDAPAAGWYLIGSLHSQATFVADPPQNAYTKVYEWDALNKRYSAPLTTITTGTGNWFLALGPCSVSVSPYVP